MRPPRSRHTDPRPVRSPAESRRWIERQRNEVTKARNAELRKELSALRRALREIVSWYDGFDDAENPVELTDDDFDRYRKLSRGPVS